VFSTVGFTLSSHMKSLLNGLPRPFEDYKVNISLRFGEFTATLGNLRQLWGIYGNFGEFWGIYGKIVANRCKSLRLVANRCK
jgi:hypothetical protein